MKAKILAMYGGTNFRKIIKTVRFIESAIKPLIPNIANPFIFFNFKLLMLFLDDDCLSNIVINHYEIISIYLIYKFLNACCLMNIKVINHNH